MFGVAVSVVMLLVVFDHYTLSRKGEFFIPSSIYLLQLESRLGKAVQCNVFARILLCVLFRFCFAI